jgi:hypothetical protein
MLSGPPSNAVSSNAIDPFVSSIDLVRFAAKSIVKDRIVNICIDIACIILIVVGMF